MSKPSVKIGKAKKYLHICIGSQYRPVTNSSNLYRVYLNLIHKNNQAKVLNVQLVKLTFFGVQK